MIITKTVPVYWSGNNKQRLESLGYIFSGYRTLVNVKVEDLSNSGKYKIEVACDYCNIIYLISWDKFYARTICNEYTNKVACKGCSILKQKETLQLKYGVTNVSNIKSVVKKREQTFWNNFGVSNPSKLQSIKDKKSETTMKNYGVDNPFKSLAIIEDIKIKKALTMYNNESQISSKQQRHICKVLKAKLNYPVDSINLDMAFPNDKIYIEYDGSGHDLSVVLSNITKEEFQTQEQKRYYFLKNRGWKMVRIISKNDSIMSNYILKKMKNYYEYLFLEGLSWVKFDLDNKTVTSTKESIKFNFGKLKRLPKRKVHLKSL